MANGTGNGHPVITAQPRPAWLPDTQGFLAIAIVAILTAVIMVLLLKDYTNLNEKVYGALLTLLGVVAACFKDVYSFFFGSSKGSEKKDDALISGQVSSTTPPTPPVSPVSTTTTVTDASTVTKTEPTSVATATEGAKP